MKNWRQISLFNLDLKILSKALSEKSKEVLSDVISSQQTGYVKNRWVRLNYATTHHHPPPVKIYPPPPTTTHHHPPPSTTTHHQPKYIYHHPPPEYIHHYITLPTNWKTNPRKPKYVHI